MTYVGHDVRIAFLKLESGLLELLLSKSFLGLSYRKKAVRNSFTVKTQMSQQRKASHKKNTVYCVRMAHIHKAENYKNTL